MKKLLTLISALGMTTTGLIGAADVVSCSKKDKSDSKDVSFKLKADYKITVQIKDKSVNAFSDTPTRDGDNKLITATFIVKSQNDSLKENKNGDKPTLQSVLDKASATFIDKDSSNLVELVFNSINNNTEVKQQVKMDDITAFVEIGSIFDNNLSDIDVPVWIYGLEHVDFNTGQEVDEDGEPIKENAVDRKPDIAKINDNIFAKINEKINDKAIKLSADNAEVKYIAKPADQYVPLKATIRMKANSGSKVLGLAGETEVEFTLQQNIQPSGFLVVGNAEKKAKIISVDAKNGDKEQGNVELQIVKSANIAIWDRNVNITTWKSGDDFTVKDTNVVAVGDAADGIGLLAQGKVNSSTTITFHREGFKQFDMKVTIVESIS